PSFAPPCVSPAGRFVVVRRTDALGGNETGIVDLADGQHLELARNDPQFARWPVPPLALDLRAANGETPLKAMLFRPSDFDPTRRYPLLDLFYPGPQLVFLSRVFNSRIQFLAQAIAELGCVVLMTDSRALPFRSRALHQAGYPETAEPQLADQAAAVSQVARDHPYVDGGRVGVLGFSAGGNGAVQALLDYADTFHVGVAINGNYHLRNVIAVWPNKYVGPATPDILDAQDLALRADRLRGKLLLVAADMDENVNIANTFRMADGFARANRDFELLIVPNQGHVMMLNDGYTVRRVFDFLTRALLGDHPPTGIDLRFAPHQLARMAKANMLDSAWT
ncbi:MAG: prolyl oligopeptidase family serine peptidase, partial [Pseudolabrys sp.]|nr:prolyl oligopeptidase family serine peptidase [Pseudolabrys sp.]